MKRNTKIAIAGLSLLVLVMAIGMKAYLDMKIRSSEEAANVFVSPMHINLFNEHFTPYPEYKAQQCYALDKKLKGSRNLRLIDADWGVYVYQADVNGSSSIFIALTENVQGKWGVECWEK